MTALLIALMLTLPSYTQTISLGTDGSAALDVEVAVPAGTASPLQLPLVSTDLTDATVTGLADAAVAVSNDRERPLLTVVFPRPPATAVTLCVRGRIPGFFPGLAAPPKAFGNRTLRFRFVNAAGVRFGTVTSEVVLPPGFVVTSVDDSEPPATESSTTPPFAIVSRGGRHGVSITAQNVSTGGQTAMVFRFKERHFSPIVPLALAALGAAYLFRFRDLTRTEPPS